MPKSLPFPPGQMVGCFQIVELLADATRARDRRYAVHTLCCDQAMERSGHALIESERGGKQLCLHCATSSVAKAPVPTKSALFKTGERVGPVTVIGPGGLVGWREVRWGCCGKEELLKISRLHVMRHREKQGHQCMCKACTDAVKQSSLVKRAAPWMLASAVLPPGVLSAALAWPRPQLARA